MANGIDVSLASDPSGALDRFWEAAAVFERHPGALLPDSPHGLGATIAALIGDLAEARRFVARALEHQIGGEHLTARHAALDAWLAMRSAAWAEAERLAASIEPGPADVRARLILAAVEVALARRAGDLNRLTDAWAGAEPLLRSVGVGLLELELLGELGAAAARLGTWTSFQHQARRLGDLVRGAGEPPVWTLPLRWAGFQAAVASNRADVAARRRDDLMRVPPSSPAGAVLHRSAQIWVQVLEGVFEPKACETIATELETVGLRWEAAQLVGQAAIRCTDQTETRQLLETARRLKSSFQREDDETEELAESLLTAREREIATFVVDGLTYKQIGAELFISPKTVEHHVARIRQKLGASSRAEMLTALRTQLA